MRAVGIEMSVSGLNCAHANQNDWWDAIGPGISIEDALTDDFGQPLLVNGFLFVGEDGNVTMASLMAVSLPPIPGGINWWSRVSVSVVTNSARSRVSAGPTTLCRFQESSTATP